MWAGHDQVFPPERTISLDRTDPGTARKVGWKKLRTRPWDRWIDVYEHLRPRDGVAYALAQVHAKTAADVYLEVRCSGPHKVWLNGRLMLDGIRRISSPGRRVYVGAKEIPLVRKGLGMVVLSTPRGVMCDRDAREAKGGGEVICEVW